jgi:STE24 endopeptidase
MELNLIGSAILAGLVLVWNLDFIATLLNLKAFSRGIPEELSDLLDEAGHARAREYATESARASILESTVSLTALLVFWFAGGFPWLDSLVRARFGDGIPAGLGFFSFLFLASHLLTLPFRIHSTFVLEAKFGFNRTTPATFMADEIKGLLLAAVLGLPLAAAVLWIFLHVAHAWIWAWLVFTGFQLVLTYLAPTLILPIFNKFEPMPEGSTREAIEKLAGTCSFPLQGVYVMDGSKRSTRANAYFIGFGKSKRIVLYDTLLEKHSDEELVAILAHEIGHFKLRHFHQRLAASIVQSAVLFFLLGLATDPHGAFARELSAAFGVQSVSPHTGIVFFLVLFGPVGRLLGIVFNAWSRRHEFQADAFARRATGNPAPLGAALKKLTTDNLSHPTPHRLRVLLDYDHPPLTERLAALGRDM